MDSGPNNNKKGLVLFFNICISSYKNSSYSIRTEKVCASLKHIQFLDVPHSGVSHTNKTVTE